MRMARVVISVLLLATTVLGKDKRSDTEFTVSMLRSYRNAAGVDSGANRAEYVVETKDQR